MSSIWSYSQFLPEVENKFRLTLGEGGTPLVRSVKIGPSLGLNNLYFKLESLNPTGSYKDRFAASAISHLLQKSIPFCLATSSGNTGSSLAAYCAIADIPCFLILVEGIPEGKMEQMILYGAHTITINGFGKDLDKTKKVFATLHDLAQDFKTNMQISAYHYCPTGMAGVQTIACEIAEEMKIPDVHIFSPAGGGGLALAMTKGFRQWEKRHPGYSMPRIHCVQPEGNNTIAGPLNEGLEKAQAVNKSTTTISGLQVPDILDGDKTLSACRETGGCGVIVTDKLVFDCQKQLAMQEGILCEPAGAVALAGLKTALNRNMINNERPVVCLVTGHGFKDRTTMKALAGERPSMYFDQLDAALYYIKAKIKTPFK